MRPTGPRTRRHPCAWPLAALAALLLSTAIGPPAPARAAEENEAAEPPVSEETEAMAPHAGSTACEQPGTWVHVASGDAYDRRVLYRDLAEARSVVLLGEHHDDFEHHRWQLHTLAALLGRVEQMVIGFEAFPRRIQPVLDRWVAGELSEDEFLKESEWREVWRFDPDLYMPLFQFARMHRIPMVALNVERTLVSRVGEEGWAAVPETDREGVSDPAPAGDAYERRLARVFQMSRPGGDDKTGAAPPAHGTAPPAHGTAPPAHATTPPAHSAAHGEAATAALEDVLGDPGFRRFVEAQLTWDRAMAEALATARRDHPGATVAGIIGAGHLENGYGVPHQLRDLGVDDAAVLLPVETGVDCAHTIGTGYADVVFALPPSPDEAKEPDRPKLGVFISDGEKGVRIARIIEGSVAEATGLEAEDEIVQAAGLQTQKMGELIEIVGRQAPGTWLPLTVQRDGKEVEFVAKFPPRPTPDE